MPKNQNFQHFLDLIFELVIRDLKVKYTTSGLGFAWVLVNPLLQLCVYYFIFHVVIKNDIVNFTSYVFIGILIFNWFQGAVSQAAGAVTQNRELVGTPGFPMTSLPVIVVIIHLIFFLLALPVLLPFLWLEGYVVRPPIILLPLLILIQFLLTLGLAYLIAGLNVIIRDIQQVLGVILRLLFFMTPIFYSINDVPDNLLLLYQLNPLVSLLNGYRTVFRGDSEFDWAALILVGLVGIFFLWLGLQVFKNLSHRFADEV
jgi:lipopolysaccharide transport system permease protein